MKILTHCMDTTSIVANLLCFPTTLLRTPRHYSTLCTIPHSLSLSPLSRAFGLSYLDWPCYERTLSDISYSSFSSPLLPHFKKGGRGTTHTISHQQDYSSHGPSRVRVLKNDAHSSHALTAAAIEGHSRLRPLGFTFTTTTTAFFCPWILHVGGDCLVWSEKNIYFKVARFS